MDSCSHLNWEWSWLACLNRGDKKHFLIEFTEHLLAQSIQNILMNNTNLHWIELLFCIQCQQNLSVHWQTITAYNVNFGHIFVSLSVFIEDRCLFLTIFLWFSTERGFKSQTFHFYWIDMLWFDYKTKFTLGGRGGRKGSLIIPFSSFSLFLFPNIYFYFHFIRKPTSYCKIYNQKKY